MLIKIDDIIINNRHRQDYGDIEGLAESIKNLGLLVPIIIDEHNVLVAGERRIKAHRILGISEIEARVKPKAEIDNEIYEIIENIERKQFSWQEEAIAVERLHELLSAINPDWSGRKTAAKLGVSIGGVSMNLSLAKAVQQAPETFQHCTTMRQALKTLKKQKVDEAMLALSLKRQKTNYAANAKNIVFHGDCLDLIKRIPDDHINAVISDPIFGIDVFDTRFVNKNESPEQLLNKYQDDQVHFRKLFDQLFPELDRVLKPDASIALMCGFQNIEFLVNHLEKIGFRIDPLPAIWFRGAQQARSNQPLYYLNRAYDFFIYGTRGDSTLAKQGTMNVIDNCLPVPTADRVHPSQKPISLGEEFIQRFTLPGHIILDPMCGSGFVLSAAIKLGRIPIGFELDQVSYQICMGMVIKAMEMKNSGQADQII